MYKLFLWLLLSTMLSLLNAQNITKSATAAQLIEQTKVREINLSISSDVNSELERDILFLSDRYFPISMSESLDLESEISFEANFLQKISDKYIKNFFIGPNLSYHMTKEVKQLESFKIDLLSYGILAKKYLNNNFYILGGLGINQLNIKADTTGIIIPTLKTKGDSSYFFGIGHKIHEHFNIEFSLRYFSGEFILSGYEPFLLGDFESRQDLNISLTRLSLVYQF